MLGAIEAGGTKFVCAVGTGPRDLEIERFPTTTPDQTMKRVFAFFSRYPPVEAMGVACFGPIDPDPHSATWGFITTTPKLEWQNFDFAGTLHHTLGMPIAFDTDVNAAACGEARWGAAQDLDTLIYLTVGTGIGGGALVNGRLLHGLMHAEMGHIRVPRDTVRDPFPGVCPFHGDCLEGIASGTAVQARWKRCAEELPADHEAWDLEAEYLALGMNNWICTLSPQKIIVGGGVMEQPGLLAKVRANVRRLLNGYVQKPEILEGIDAYIVPPGLGSKSGVLGALALAESVRHG